MKKNLNKLTITTLLFVFLFSGCNNSFFKKVDTRQTPINAQERARKNIEEGRGVSIGDVLKRGGTNFEFSSSNPLWRASLEILDFLPLTTVDYSGGVIISEWYTNSNSKNQEALKITVRFLSNEIQTNSLKIIVHQRICEINNNCLIKEVNSKIKEELVKSILTKAAVIQENQTKKK